jgi:hypothetical protein
MSNGFASAEKDDAARTSVGDGPDGSVDKRRSGAIRVEIDHIDACGWRTVLVHQCTAMVSTSACHPQAS